MVGVIGGTKGRVKAKTYVFPRTKTTHTLEPNNKESQGVVNVIWAWRSHIGND